MHVIGQNFSVVKQLLVVFGLSVLLIACATPGRSFTGRGLTETVETQILPDTTKMFEYRLQAASLPDHVRVVTPGQRPQQTGGVANHKSLIKLEENAAFAVNHLGYCKEGYLRIDYRMSQQGLWLKGECKEGATAADLAHFGSKNRFDITGQ